MGRFLIFYPKYDGLKHFLLVLASHYILIQRVLAKISIIGNVGEFCNDKPMKKGVLPRQNIHGLSARDFTDILQTEIVNDV